MSVLENDRFRVSDQTLKGDIFTLEVLGTRKKGYGKGELV
jgi:hypothetical protein